MKKFISLFVILTALVCLMTACGETTVTSNDGRFSVEIPSGWVKEDINEEAVLGVMSSEKEQYVSVFVEEKSSFEEGFTLDDFAAIAYVDLQEAFEDATMFDISADITVANDISAKRYTLSGFESDLAKEVKISVVAFEGDDVFYKFVFWATPEEYKDGEQIFLKMLDTFKKQ